MKAMTKRDVADMAFVLMGISLTLTFLHHAVVFVAEASRVESVLDQSRIPWVLTTLLYLLAVAGAIVLLVFRRRILVDLLFREPDESRLVIPETLAPLSRLSFWVRLFGTYTLVVKIIGALEFLTVRIPEARWNFLNPLWWQMIGRHFLSAGFALLVIWKSESIGRWIEGMGASNKPFDATP